jgi:PKD repeat protein
LKIGVKKLKKNKDKKNMIQINKKIALILAFSLIITSTMTTVQAAYSISVNTDQSEYYLGETVRATLRLKENGDPVGGAPVCISIIYGGEVVFSLCGTTNSQGSFSVFYQANDGLGFYQVSAHANPPIDITAYDSFNVVSTTVNADANGPYYGVAGIPIQFQGDAQGGKSPHTWQWLFGDGVNTSDERNPTYTYQNTGNYSVTLTVRDRGGNQGTDQTTVTITDEMIADTNGPYEGIPNNPIQFTGSAYGGYPPYIWHWDLGDGNTSEEQNPEHIYNSIGIYIINLTVTDQKDISAYSTTTVNIIENFPPDKPIKPSGATNGKAGVEYIYTSSTTDPNVNQLFYQWDWGDGNISNWLGPFESGHTANASYSWVTQGDYQIKVKTKDVYDAESEWSDPLPISMPKNKIEHSFSIFFRHHPYLFLIFRNIFEFLSNFNIN